MHRKPARLLIVNRTQFGYHTDTYMYCKYLDSNYSVTYLGMAKATPVELPAPYNVNVTVIETGRRILPGKFGRYLAFLHEIWKQRNLHDVVFVKYFPSASLVRLMCGRNKTILDIRSRSVIQDRVHRRIADSMIRIDATGFRWITAISPKVAGLFSANPTGIIPCGTELPSSIAVKKKPIVQPNCIRLLYVGTLEKRNLDDVITGLHIWQQQHTSIRVTLRMVGNYDNLHGQELIRLTNELEMSEQIEFLGYMTHQDLSDVYLDSDIGIVHVPNEDRYDGQPSTKMFEYWSFGIPALCTDTPTNRIYASNHTMILYPDNPLGFASALDKYLVLRDSIDTDLILTQAAKHSYEDIVHRHLRPILQKVIDSN